MSEFLEHLKARHAESQKRFLAKQAQLNSVNQEFQVVAQEFNAWQTLLNLETRKEQMAAVALTAPTVSPASAPSSPAATSPEVNKTEIVRELLRQHASGMTPSEIWKQEQIKTQFPHRAYLYSVLKRLKDRGDITEKRGKYCFKFSTKPEELQGGTPVQVQ
ncbi:MAG: hypothetical protein ACYDCD_03895 [Candidatus Acidiferrales bacterium]